MLTFVFNVVSLFCQSALLSYFWVYLLAVVALITSIQLIKYIIKVR